jgi:hypothetical protein
MSRSLAAFVLIGLATTVLAGCSDEEPPDPVERLRDGPATALLEQVALDGTYCVLTTVEEDGEGQLDGNTGYATQAYFEVIDGRQYANNLSVSIDHFPTARRARDEALAAGADLAALVGGDSVDEGPLVDRPGSVSYGTVVTDFEGRPRGTFAASGSFGLSSVPDVASFAAVADQLIDGLLGDVPLVSVPPCSS